VPRVEPLEDRVVPSVIGFDDLPSGTVLSNQYQNLSGGTNNGVVFVQGSGNTLPFIQAVGSLDGAAHSGTQVAEIGPPPGAELLTPSILGQFGEPVGATTAYSHVGVYVGEFGSQFGTFHMNVTLTALAVDGTTLGSTSTTVTSGAGFNTLLQLDDAQGRIASFTLSGDLPGGELGLDDLTFTKSPGNPLPPQFTLSASPYSSGVTVAPGGAIILDTITVNTFFGSDGNVTFSISGLPQGVLGSFTPLVGGHTTLLLSASPVAPPTGSHPATAAIIANPVNAALTGPAQTLHLVVAVAPDFAVSVNSSAPVQLPAGTPVNVPMTLTRSVANGSPFTGQVTLFAITGTGVTASINPSTLGTAANPWGSGLTTPFTLTLDTDPSQPIPPTFSVTVFAVSGQEAVSTQVTAQFIPVIIASFSPNLGKTPQAQAPGTLVDVQGQGFRPGSLIQFGNAYAQVAPTYVSADGTDLHVEVPQFATDGPLVYFTPPGPGAPNGYKAATSSSSFAVDSYRNINGFDFPNPALPGVSFQDVVDLFGYNQTHLQIPNPLAPGLLPNIVTSVPDPFAEALALVANQFLNDGQCQGMSLASLRLMNGDVPFSDFALQVNASATTNWNLQYPLEDMNSNITDLNGADALVHYIHIQHIAQFSAQALANFAADIAANLAGGPGALLGQVTGALRAGDHPMLSIRMGFDGHVLVAYNIEADPADPEGYYIDVYDSNQPFTSAENTNADAHRSVVLNSRIHVFSSGHWEFPGFLPQEDWTGDMSAIVVIPYSVIPVQPTMPMSTKTLASPTSFFTGATASTTQITDAAGRTLLLPDGSLNTDPNTAIPGGAVSAPVHGTVATYPYYLISDAGAYTQKVQANSNGTYSDTVFGPAFGVQMSATGNTGVSDQLTFDADHTAFTFQTGNGSSALSTDLMAHTTDDETRDATIATTSFQGGGDSFAYDPTQQFLTYTHNGPATQFTVTLNGANAQGQAASFVSPALAIGDGDTVTIRPTSWVHLDQTAVMITFTHPNGTTTIQVLRNAGANPLETSVLGIAAVEGAIFQGRVATFTDLGGAAPPGIYSARIAWGDGQFSAGSITPNGDGTFTVTGMHTYTEEGTPSVGVTITDVAGTSGQGSAIAAIADASLAVVAPNVTATAGAPFTGVVATFSDADPSGTAADYTATVTWGDGDTSTGTVSAVPGGFAVTASNTYAAASSYAVHVQVTDAGGAGGAAGSTATVVNLGTGVQGGQSSGIGFWQSKNGQKLINSFNGGPTSTALSTWLATNFANLYGASAGANNLTGVTNIQVAAFYLTLFSLQGPKLDAEVLDTALDIYATTFSLGGAQAAAFGFRVTADGLGASSYNVGSNGSAFGVTNNQTLTVYAILKAADRYAVAGLLYDGDKTLRSEAATVFGGIDAAGGL
jgi:hypothetical protein